MRHIRHDATRELLHAQGPLLLLITAIFTIYFAQETAETPWWVSFMVFPVAITEAWREALGGDLGIGQLREFGTLLSYAFLHGSPEHVINNMLFLWIFAALIAELVGHRWMFATFAFTAVTGSLLHVVLNPGEFIPMLGASGAVMGFEGAYLGLAVRWLLPDPHIWPMSRPISPGRLALIGVAGLTIDYYSLLSRSESNVAYAAHMGGFAGGLIMAALIPVKPRGARHR